MPVTHGSSRQLHQQLFERRCHGIGISVRIANVEDEPGGRRCARVPFGDAVVGALYLDWIKREYAGHGRVTGYHLAIGRDGTTNRIKKTRRAPHVAIHCANPRLQCCICGTDQVLQPIGPQRLWSGLHLITPVQEHVGKVVLHASRQIGKHIALGKTIVCLILVQSAGHWCPGANGLETGHPVDRTW